MAGEPSHVKQLSLNHVCKIGLRPAKFAAGFVDTGGKFAAGVVDTSGKLPPVLLTTVANLPLVSLTPVVHLDYLREFSKKFEMILMLLSGAWGKVIHEKNLKQKIS
jgi:hypothetical protein